MELTLREGRQWPESSATRDILVVEDEVEVLNLWKRHIARWGYTFDAAESGEDGLALARKYRYRVLVCDLALPGMSGQELIGILRAEQPEMEVIVITGRATVEMAVDLMKSGVYEFFTKPVYFHRVNQALQKCLLEERSRKEEKRLRRLTQELEALNERKEKFIAITSHELRTPVSVVSNIAELLFHRLINNEHQYLVQMLSRASSQLVEIVNQMHEISRARSDRISLNPSHFQLLECCQEAVGECWLLLQERRHKLSIDVDDQLFITADRGKLKKVLRELLQNAIKFTDDEGSIAIRVILRPPDHLELSVSDTGIGIPEDQRERIFELFYEVGDFLHRKSSSDLFGGGMGVGLSIVKEIVTAHQGQVELSSEPQKGSVFSIILPVRFTPPL